MRIVISPKLVEEIYSQLSKIGCLGESPASGYLRASWSIEESQAYEYFQKLGKELDLQSCFDEVGNLSIYTTSASGQYIESGSHLDTVVMGGNFDGAAGVVAGFLAISEIVKSRVDLKHGLKLRIWRGEEGGTYNLACKGSRAAIGQFPIKALENKFKGISLEQSILNSGFSVKAIQEQKALLSQSEIDSILLHVELHIEQANYLEANKIDLGIVTSIRGPSRFRIEILGQFDHSGGTPMGISYRRDANLALAHILVALDKLANTELEAGHDLVQTIGVINNDPTTNESDPRVYQNATAKISGYAYFDLDIRSNNLQFKNSYCRKVQETIEAIAKHLNTVASVTATSATEPVESLDLNAQLLMESISRKNDISCCRMPCGALHDCAYLAKLLQSSGNNVPIGMIFIPCLNGKSHCPEEFASYEAIAKGATVLAQSMLHLAKDQLL